MASRDGKISIIQRVMLNGQFWEEETSGDDINLLANSLKTVGKLALKTLHFKDMKRHCGARWDKIT